MEVNVMNAGWIQKQEPFYFVVAFRAEVPIIEYPDGGKQSYGENLADKFESQIKKLRYPICDLNIRTLNK